MHRADGLGDRSPNPRVCAKAGHLYLAVCLCRDLITEDGHYSPIHERECGATDGSLLWFHEVLVGVDGNEDANGWHEWIPDERGILPQNVYLVMGLGWFDVN